MAKKKTKSRGATSSRSKTGRSTAKGRSGGRKSSAAPVNADGKQLVIVESPAKARTINKYLGGEYVVMASVGHVRDLPKRNPKGVDNPVPGVDLEHGFEPTYEVIHGKGKTITDLKRAAKQADAVWLATDLDREGEAIAWHLAEALNVPLDRARRVVFNAITQNEIQRAFADPQPIDMDKVNAQQARRILDRIVGYQVSPLLWKKVAGGLSAGRVQSVAVRLVAEREREIQAFVPDEYWKVSGCFTINLDKADELAAAWRKWLAEAPEKPSRQANGHGNNKGRSNREKLAWLAEHESIMAELVEFAGRKFQAADAEQALKVAEQLGFVLEGRQDTDDPKGKGPAARRTRLVGNLADRMPEFRVESIDTKRTSSKPPAPFITSTLQQAAANQLGFSTSLTMRLAQQLYEGVEVRGHGSVGLITYMRTDSTHLAREAVNHARDHIDRQFGKRYLPERSNVYSSSNRDAQQAHEAIRPTEVALSPEDPAIRNSLSDQQFKLYQLIWRRFVACQMTAAQWDSTTVSIAADTEGGEAVFRASGRTLVFDGFYRVAGLPNQSDEATLPRLEENQTLAPIQIDPTQHFTSPPARYTEASLVRKLESEGIGRPSTYAAIIKVIQDRNYVEKISNRFHATDLGMVVTDKLAEAFPRIMDVGYTRQMESELDAVEEQHRDWVEMLNRFYGPFRENLDQAYEDMRHAKAETQPAPHKCAECGAPTVYRFGRNGRFLSCSRYPQCKYAAPIDKEGNPVEPELTDIACPECGRPMMLRKGRYGPFLSCSGYPECQGIVNLDKKGCVKPPSPPPLTTDLPCPKCESPLNLRRSKRGPWLSCSTFPKCRGRLAWSKLDEQTQKQWEIALENHEKAHPQPQIHKIDGTPVGENYQPQSLGGEISDDDSSTDINNGYSESDAA
jgi:DNA topoisomerase-1